MGYIRDTFTTDDENTGQRSPHALPAYHQRTPISQDLASTQKELVIISPNPFNN
jgi:hypothetical protein